VSSDVKVSAPTEDRHPGSTSIDSATTLEVLRLLNHEDATVPRAVAQLLPQLAVLVDLAVRAIQAGGRVHYFGAGTSGRLAVLDAAELLPTFNAPEGMFVAHHAGGERALLRAVENVEDDQDAGRAEAGSVAAGDVVLGLTASGRTPFVGGALQRARELGAVTALVTSNPRPALAAHADHVLVADTGPEVLTGSTRLKAGTATKLVLNTITTIAMVQMGKVYENLMVDLRASNIKLWDRGARIVATLTGLERDHAMELLRAADGHVKLAVVMHKRHVSSGEARLLLDKAGGKLREAVHES
jgi:N-acetylmuramic acid 6-phosphate etherase